MEGSWRGRESDLKCMQHLLVEGRVDLHPSATAGAGHRGFQDTTLGQEVPCMLVLICNSMYFVV